VALGCAAVILLGMVAGLVSLSLVFTILVKDIPSLDQLPVLLDAQDGQLMQPTRIYDRTGQKVISTLENPGVPRKYLSLDPNQPDHFSPELVRAAVGYLDADYWRSSGVALRSLTSPVPVTIPERLVSDLLLWQEPPGLARTLRMRLLAAQVINRYGHVQVLEWYLNSALFGHLAYGADSAARLYLDKSASQVDLSEAALLAASAYAPGLNPLDAPAVALRLQQDVLQKLDERGVISSEEHIRAAAGALIRSRQAAGQDAAQPEPTALAKTFSQVVVDRLAQRVSRDRIERGGLKIITTLDYELQQELACLTHAQLSRLVAPSASQPAASLLPDGSPCESARLLPALPPGSPALPASIQSSSVVMDAATGQVLALQGDTGITGNEAALLPHQPGTLLTPFAAIAGFARGLSPASLEWDIPPGEPETVLEFENPDKTFHGPVRMRTALANDYLVPIAQLVEQVGASNVWRLAGAFGLDSLRDETSSGLIYEGGQVSPLELAQAYAVFANQGSRTGQRIAAGGEIQPAVVQYVEDLGGKVWLDASLTESQAAASPQLAYLVHHVLSDTTARWPSLGYPNSLEIGRPSAAKIGQVKGDRQAWAAGYTPQRVAVTWLGLPGIGSQQIDPKLAAGTWYALMQYANRLLPAKDWPAPAGVTQVEVCDPSGLLPTGACPEVVREVFLTSSEPSGADTLYQKVQINRETGRLATVFTPPELVEEKVFMLVPQSARTWAEAAGLPVPPQEYDAIQPPEPSPEARISSPLSFSFVNDQVQVEGTAAGDQFSFYQLLVGQGINPQTWLQIGPDGNTPVIDGTLGVWDTTGLDGLYAVRLLVVREDQSIDTDTIQVTVDNTAPLVRVPYPLDGQEIESAAGEAVILQVEASDSVAIDRVEWWMDGKMIGESSLAPYVYSWAAQEGEHVLEVLAFDSAGNQSSSGEVRFFIKTP
jgi:membrane peptidoglycan carboxypeptidase